MPGQDITHFTTVDHSSDPTFFLHFLDQANKLPGVIAWKPAIIDGLRLQRGMRVLDVGCGLGDDAFDLVSLVGPSGRVTGVDFSESLITEAVRRAADRSLPVNFEVGDAQALRFPNGSFDAVRTERLLMHVPDALEALSEMSRVLRPRGRMAVHDFDWESQFCDSPYKDTTRKIAVSFCDGMKNGWIGRCLPRLFREVGMTDISISFRNHHGHLRFPPVPPGRPCFPSRRQWRHIGTGSRPVVDPPRAGERRRNVPLRLHRVYCLWYQGLSTN
jgi:ubiquinone/menaquinone biosynthesis C-methylase UbiE